MRDEKGGRGGACDDARRRGAYDRSLWSISPCRAALIPLSHASATSRRRKSWNCEFRQRDCCTQTSIPIIRRLSAISENPNIQNVDALRSIFSSFKSFSAKDTDECIYNIVINNNTIIVSNKNIIIFILSRKIEFLCRGGKNIRTYL